MTEKRPDPKTTPLDDPRQAEADINALEGVLSSKIVTNRAGEILEIHVVSSPERNAKQTLRDLESMFLVTREIRIDRNKVSIARYSENPETASERNVPPRVAESPRLRFINLKTNLTPDGGSVEVTLARGGVRAFGESTFPLGSGPIAAVAEATLRSVQRFFDNGRFDVITVEQRPIGRYDGVFVQVEAVRGGAVDALIGASIVRRDANLAAMHATLDAVNRYLGRLDPSQGTELIVGSEDGD